MNVYIEGIDNGKEFLSAAAYASKKKPILALKAGSTDAGAHAAMSHTGSLTGSDEVYDAALKQSGIMRVKNTRELFDIFEFFQIWYYRETKQQSIFARMQIY